MPAYHSIFDHHDCVKVVSAPILEQFFKEWKYHHPLSDEQLKYADEKLFIDRVSYYHGGTPLYQLFRWNFDGTRVFIPGIWHEAVLNEAPPSWKFQRASDILEAISLTVHNQPVVVIKNRLTGVQYLQSRQENAEIIAGNMSVVFAHRDVHMVATKYGFDLDFRAESIL